VRAYRQAAEIVRQLKEPVGTILAAKGLQGLLEIPHLGESLAQTIEQLATTGRWALLQRLRGDVTPERMLTTVPGIGREMAARIHGRLGIKTLGELEAAAYDGRLTQVPGMGRKRIEAVRDTLAGRFRRGRRVVSSLNKDRSDNPPRVSTLLEIDAEFREKARRDQLLRIAPRHLNPTGEAWLPILHTTRNGDEYTALYSNTARAHEMGTIGDWVVIYRDNTDGGGQWTVITSLFGPLKGRRVVRGRERECAKHYGAVDKEKLFGERKEEC
jgi:hypothetical protein